MECNNCSVNELKFEIKVEGELNQSILPQVIEHLTRRNIEVKEKEQGLIIPESGAKEFMDFCEHFMATDRVEFRINKEEWKPFSQIETVMDMQWIDNVIKKELITCHYQPIINGDGTIFAYEMLSRFQNEDGSMIYPNEIFPAAKSRGRLYALDRVCRMTAVKYAAKLEDKKAFINFIPTSIYSPEFCLRSTTLLANQLNVDPKQLVFEVVETEQVDDLDHLKRILTYYKERGFNYALDDVGEGFSTAEVLAELKPQYMKLDMQYVQGVAEEAGKQKVALSFLEKAIAVGSVPLAEGVETEEDFNWLKEKGYELFQGYYFGKPEAEPRTELVYA
ncbi:putative membrane protein YjcC [Planococcus massiliensis]|uniref:Putative membrane protein YjcC n=1 Tax=Planococcus massiliensis TaxID=1499687 RepID=A0A098EHG7_9BACL|nr:EAL domain-containing protein [Planococcus massiliensis]CEG21262.1 putative membrane protein YjcC [Planococcus massiliensis]